MNDDLISRSALKKAIKSYADDQYAENEYLGEYAIMDIINNAPTVEAYTEDDVHTAIKEGHQVGYEMAKTKFERPTGEWIINTHSMVQKCSLCGNEEQAKDVGTIDADKHFCPNCGADMRGGRE